MIQGFRADVVKIQTSGNYRLLFMAIKMESWWTGSERLES